MKNINLNLEFYLIFEYENYVKVLIYLYHKEVLNIFYYEQILMV